MIAPLRLALCLTIIFASLQACPAAAVGGSTSMITTTALTRVPLTPVTLIPVPAVATSIAKALVRYFGKEGAQETSEYLSKKGGQEILDRVTRTATKQGGDEAVEQVAVLTGKYGPDALTALDNAPSILPVIKAIDELPAAQAKIALTRLSAGKTGRELAEVTSRFGASALRSELKHPGVGLILVRNLGDEGADIANRLTQDEAIAIGRHAADIAKLPPAQRAGVLTMLKSESDRMVTFVGRFVEANPGKTLFTAATTAVILAEPERILGGDELAFDAEGNPIVIHKSGLAGRAMDAGSNVAAHVSSNYVRPIYLTLAAFAGMFAVAWIALKVWQFRKLKRLMRSTPKLGKSEIS